MNFNVKVNWGKQIYDIDKMLAAMALRLNSFGDLLIKDFERTTATFDHSVAFIKTVTPNSVTVHTEDKAWNMLDKGTRVRYAIMSKDFRAKTQQNFLGSRPGQGGLVFVSRKHPMPGIKARNFTHMINIANQQMFKKVCRDILKAGVIK